VKKLLTPEYEALITQKHLVKPWGGDGWRWIPDIARLVVQHRLKFPSVLDYGAGRSTFRNTMKWAMPHVNVTEYDPGVAGLNTLPLGKFDIVLCTDVLEHVERQFVDATLDRLREYTECAALLCICTRLASSTLPDGTNTHITVEPSAWWADKIQKRWKDIKVLDDGKDYTVIAHP
jgi:hypothetical protein